MSNTARDEPLEVQAVLSDSVQFYPTRFQPTTIAPGAAHTLTVAFLPRTLGEAMATLLLRTSLGGFVLQMRGEGVQSQYQLTPVRGAKVGHLEHIPSISALLVLALLFAVQLPEAAQWWLALWAWGAGCFVRRPSAPRLTFHSDETFTAIKRFQGRS